MADRAEPDRERVTGIGGVFFKAQDPASLQAWYVEHLGVPVSDDGTVVLEWRELDPDRPASTVFAPFASDTAYFAPSTQPYMFNFRVVDMDRMLAQLRSDGCQVVGGPDDTDFGRFAWILDPEGNKIELWEPTDE